jgi:hypothetical protein
MKTSEILSHSVLKSVSAGLVATALDNYIIENGSMNSFTLTRNVTFGCVVGGSIALADYVAPSLTHMTPIPDTALFSGKTLEHRLIEVSLGTAASVGVSNYVFSSSLGTMTQQVGIIVIADVVGEYVADYLCSKPLSYLH